MEDARWIDCSLGGPLVARIHRRYVGTYLCSHVGESGRCPHVVCGGHIFDTEELFTALEARHSLGDFQFRVWLAAKHPRIADLLRKGTDEGRSTAGFRYVYAFNGGVMGVRLETYRDGENTFYDQVRLIVEDPWR